MTTANGGGKAWGVNSEYGRLRDVLLCSPENFRWLPTSSISKATLASGAKFDRQLAMKQHREMVQAYEDAGVTVHYLDPDEALPYQVYARDSSFMTPWGAVVTQMHQWWRRGEYAPVIASTSPRESRSTTWSPPSAMEGGDFDVIEPGTVLIGYCGERTQEPAARQMQGWLAKEGWEVRLAPIAEHYVHIDLMVCMLAPQAGGRLPRHHRGLGPRLAEVQEDRDRPGELPRHHAARLQCHVAGRQQDDLDRPEQGPEQALRAAGLTVYDPDVTMFTLGGGGVHCMAQALRRDPV